MTVEQRIREIARTRGRVAQAASLPLDANLGDHGLTSHSAVSLMLELEDAFDVEFPDSMMTPQVFASLGSLAEAIQTLRGPVAP